MVVALLLGSSPLPRSEAVLRLLPTSVTAKCCGVETECCCAGIPSKAGRFTVGPAIQLTSLYSDACSSEYFLQDQGSLLGCSGCLVADFTVSFSNLMLALPVKEESCPSRCVEVVGA